MTQDVDLAAQIQRAVALFQQRFSRRPTLAAAAPGRVNLIGEHTDYNDGFVLPMAIERQTLIVAAPASEPRIRLVSTQLDGQAEFPAQPGIPPGQPSWSNYVRGVVDGCLRAGFTLPGGFNAVIDSTVPVGSGLSSSAALEVATATLLEQLAGKTLAPAQKALLCQKAEHVYAGVPCGIMDQSISVMGQAGSALLLDCRSLQTRLVPMADPSVAVLIINSNVKHELTGGEYAQRRKQCEAAAAALGVRALRDATLAQLQQNAAQLDPVVFRRARHVIGEIERTTKGAQCLENGDWAGFGALMYASHAALRDDYEVSCVELDILVDLAARIGSAGGVFGSRMTGGGFGGCTVGLVQADQAKAIADHVLQGYQKQTTITATAFITRPAQGARAIPLR
ncbi:MAG: galactokinase [Phycisphaeraceae bacterium]|nr:galactokinase [Phycisphaeraceae bacterium]